MPRKKKHSNVHARKKIKRTSEYLIPRQAKKEEAKESVRTFCLMPRKKT